MDNKDALWGLLQGVKNELKVRINSCRREVDISSYRRDSCRGEAYLIRMYAYEKVAKMNKKFMAKMVETRVPVKEFCWLAPEVFTYFTVQQTIDHYLYLLAWETKK